MMILQQICCAYFSKEDKTVFGGGEKKSLEFEHCIQSLWKEVAGYKIFQRERIIFQGLMDYLDVQRYDVKSAKLKR